MTEEELRRWALDVLLCLEDWKWLWELPAPAPTPLMSPTPPLPHLPWYNASSVDLPTTFAPNVLNTSAPFADWPLLDIPNAPATCTPVPFVESSVMWAPVAQLQPQPAYPPPEWLTEGIFKPESQNNDGGNVMVENPLSHFLPSCLSIVL